VRDICGVNVAADESEEVNEAINNGVKKGDIDDI